MNSRAGEPKVRYVRIKVKSALSKSGLPDLDYALNPYVGCYHACIYCYARAYTRYREVAENWGRIIYIKQNLIDVLRKDVRKYRKGVVGVATITDPYQPIESKEELTRKSIATLLKAGFRVDVQTKSPLVTRDLDIFTASKERVEVGFTITTLDDGIASVIEPLSPRPSSRARALEKIASEGVSTWVFLGPIIPGVNDGSESIKEVIELAAETGSHLYYDWLRIKEPIKQSLCQGLSKIYGESKVPKVNATWKRKISETIMDLCLKYGVRCSPAF